MFRGISESFATYGSIILLSCSCNQLTGVYLHLVRGVKPTYNPFIVI